MGGPIFNPNFRICFIMDLLIQHKFCCCCCCCVYLLGRIGEHEKTNQIPPTYLICLQQVMGQLLTVMLSVGTIVQDSYYGTKALKLPSNFATCHATLVETTWITCGSTLRCMGVKMKEYPQVFTVKKRGYELMLTWRFGAYTKDLHHVSVFQVLHILVVWSSTIIVR